MFYFIVVASCRMSTMLLSWIILGTFLVINTKCHSRLARLNSTSVAQEKVEVDLKPKTLASRNVDKSEKHSLNSPLNLNEQSRNPVLNVSNIWYVSDDGSDDNNCHSASMPCRNLQTVLNGATDGADIYVTSDTLSLDGVHSVVLFPGFEAIFDPEMGNCCQLSSNISYNLNSLNGNLFNITCTESAVVWNMSQTISLIQLTNLWFDTDIHFNIHGLVTFKRCHFRASKVFFSVLANINEFKPTAEALGEFHSYAESHKIQLLQCDFTVNRLTVVTFNVFGVWREIVLRHCNFYGIYTFLVVGNKTMQHCDVVSAVVYQVENSTFDLTPLWLYAYSRASFAFIRFNHLVLLGPGLVQYDVGGYVGLYLYNCSFLKIELAAIISLQTVYMNISYCSFELIESPRCFSEGCVIHANSMSVNSDAAENLFLPTCLSSHFFYCLKTEIHNTKFTGSPETNQFIIKASYLSLILNKSQFTVQKQNRFTGAALVELVHPSYFEVIETSFDASVSLAKNHIYIMVIKNAYKSEFFNSHILCPKTYKSVETLDDRVVSYTCKAACGVDEYTHEGGNMTLNGTLSNYGNKRNLSLNMKNPICNPCPVGAECESSIKSLPNYWGYRNEYNHVTMIRCPDGYCCQDNNTCQGISSCEELRTGTLCGSCIENFTESLILPNCINSEKCYIELILIIYLLASLIYAVGILTINDIKRKVLELFKNLHRVIKKKPLKKEQRGKVTTVKKRDNKDDDAMKYLQILFYYVQDAELFRIKLPTDYQKGESVLIKFFQMSPEIVATLYTKVSEFCFISTASAVTKMWLKLMFGPCVLTFLGFFFVVQLLLSKFKFIKERHLKSMRSCLTRAFLLVYLFTYQQMIKGAFTLVQCVQVNSTKVLYIYGSLKCYAWWQVAIEIFICSNLIPVLFVLSSTVHYVRDGKISLKVFHLACLFPLPVFFVHILKSLFQLFQRRRPASPEIISMKEHPNLGMEINLNLNSESTDHSDASMDTLGQKYLVSSSDTDIGSEYSSDSIEDINDNKSDSNGDISSLDPMELETSRGQVIHTLLEHYKTIKIFGIRFTWLGIHKLYRTILVACNTYITEPLTRIYFMSLMLLIIVVLNAVVKPYKKNTANNVAVLSYAANMCIAMVNIGKSNMMTFGSATNRSLKNDLLSYLEMCENVLLIYVPITAAGSWAVNEGIKKCTRKLKNKRRL